jgi:uncharacterized protein YdhG (YjbR/CyaY superfamily)
MAPFTTVDAYLAAQPPTQRARLVQVRAAIRAAVPTAREVISYGIPAYKLDAGLVLFFAGWKHHYSLYPAYASVVKAFRKELARYELSKGTIRFPLAEPVPVGLITRIAALRAKEVLASAIAPKPAKRKAKPRVKGKRVRGKA